MKPLELLILKKEFQNVPMAALASIMTLVGRTNSAEFKGHAAGVLLFLGPKSSGYGIEAHFKVGGGMEKDGAHDLNRNKPADFSFFNDWAIPGV